MMLDMWLLPEKRSVSNYVSCRKIVAKTESLNDVSKVRHYGGKEVLTVKCVQQGNWNLNVYDGQAINHMYILITITIHNTIQALLLQDPMVDSNKCIQLSVLNNICLMLLRNSIVSSTTEAIGIITSECEQPPPHQGVKLWVFYVIIYPVCVYTLSVVCIPYILRYYNLTR